MKTQIPTTTTSLSDDTKMYFSQWLKSWDARVATHDDQDSLEIIREKLKRTIGVITTLQNESDQKVMDKFESDADKVKALFDNQKKKWHKDLTTAHNDILSVLFQVESVYELKNRKSYENIRLRTELSKRFNV